MIGRAPRLSPLACLFSTLLFVALWTPAAHAGMNRFYFASQMDFGAKRGFYLDLENESPGDTPCRLATLKLILAVGDGANWHFLSATPHWETGKTYSVRATIGGDNGAVLTRDGEQLAREAGAKLAPMDMAFTGGERPGWASSPAEYAVHQLTLKMTVNGKPQDISFPQSGPMPVYLFEPQTPIRINDFRVPPGAAVTIEATFRLEAVPADLRPLSPFVDRYGQSRHAEWPGKVKTSADLTAAAAEEAQRNTLLGKPKGYDAYGGYIAAPWHEKGTGFFRTVRHGGKWWLVSPDGNPTFYIGLCTAPALAWEKTPVTGREFLFSLLPSHTGPSGDLLWSRGVWGGDGDVEYAAIHSMNLLVKYGEQWQEKASASLVQRLDTWGFSGLGKWCDAVANKPALPVLSRGGVPNIARHPDVFDPAVQKTFADALRRQIEPHKNDPGIVAWSVGNEYDEIITRGEIEDILKNHADSPAARAMKAQVPDGDVEKMRRFYADAYYDFLYKTIKGIDPGHLYCGFWIVPGWWENEQDWRLIAPHCDIIGYDRYSDAFADETLTRLMRETDKPVLCGEFSFPAWYDGTRGYGLYGAAWARTDAESGTKYARFLAEASANPWCVGVAWFQYRDQPITGRGPGRGASLVLGEHYAFGLMDITDRPKWDLVTRVRAANVAAVNRRLGK